LLYPWYRSSGLPAPARTAARALTVTQRFDWMRAPGSIGRQVLLLVAKSWSRQVRCVQILGSCLSVCVLHDQDVRQRRWRQERKAQHRSSPVEWQYASCCLRWQPEAVFENVAFRVMGSAGRRRRGRSTGRRTRGIVLSSQTPHILPNFSSTSTDRHGQARASQTTRTMPTDKAQVH
jgi:hypothetical protein